MHYFKNLTVCILLCSFLMTGCALCGEDSGQASAQSVVHTISLAELKETQGYYYQLLEEGERIWYLEISEALRAFRKEAELSLQPFAEGWTQDDIERIFRYVLNDHPEYFYVEGYTYVTHMTGAEITKLTFSGTYSVTQQEAALREQQIEERTGELLRRLPESEDEYEQIRYIYETVIEQTEYDLTAPDNQNIYSVLVGKRSVCQGYAKAVQYLLQKAGLECALVTGTVEENQGHAWNLVKCNGEWYYLDATWGDISYHAGEAVSLYQPQISYDYLCITTEQLLRTHAIAEPVDLPVCDSMAANYYLREGAYFDAVDETQLRAVFDAAAENGHTEVSLQCVDEAVYRKMLRHLVEEMAVFAYLGAETGEIAFSENENQLSVTFWMTNR